MVRGACLWVGVQMVSVKTWVGVRSDPLRLLVWPVAASAAPVVRRARVRVPPLGMVVAWVAFAVVMALVLPGLGVAARGSDPVAVIAALRRDLVAAAPQVIGVLAVWALVYWAGYRRGWRGACATAKPAAAPSTQGLPPSPQSLPAHSPPAAPPLSARPRMRDPRVSILRDLRPGTSTIYH